MRASSDGWSVTIRAPVRRVLTARRYCIPPVGIHGAMERAYNLTARQWQSWMDEAYRPSYNVTPCG
jgi:hypothetical protein